MNVYIPYTRLPSEYQEVEYIGTTGTQYINTGIFPGTNIQVETKITVQSTAQEKTVFGNYKSSSTPSYLYYHLTAFQNAWYFGINNSERHAGSYSPVIGTQYEIVYNNENNQLSVNGTEVGSVSGTQGQSGSTLYISARGTTNDCYGYYNYYYFKVFNKTTGEYEREMFPCYRKQDGVIGMYDLVNNQFYTNSGTGTFSKGNDVKGEVKNIYIGEYKPYEFSYDFTTGSTSDLQSKGWTVPSGSVVNSSGYYNSNKNRGWLEISLPQLQIAAQTATKVIYWLSWTASGGQQRSFNFVNGSSNICWLYGDGNNATGGNQAVFGKQTLVHEDGYTYGRNGTFTTTVTVDLVNKTRKYEGTNHTTLTGTVTDTAITEFRNVNGLIVYGEQTAYITSIGVKIIY